ncbi:MAG: phosphate/phosphite/phosphonate ABC transporter substrate-binding protein [Deltaproteobacteria bacterium]|jgi:hypothetical protein|nr:phosphate/phosphite/phosphonate ABC transporter substrate-binding protein [Deltaproteobacteria bacterium]
MKKYWISVLLFTLFFCFDNGYVEAESLDFAVIQPGQPGTEAEARPVMDALADYFQRKLGPGITIKGRYFNQLEPALTFLKTSPPAWGIVQLGVYAGHAGNFKMTPMAATRPGGFTKDVWRLIAGQDAVSKWRNLKGNVSGNMLFETKSAACLLFGMPYEGLPFTLEGTFRPLRDTRSVVKGKIAGVVLDRVQYETVKTMSLGSKIKVLHTSRELPTSPVVWFGTPNGTTKKLAGLLLGMKEDPNAEKLLALLQTDGFGPADPDLAKFHLDGKTDACFTP